MLGAALVVSGVLTAATAAAPSVTALVTLRALLGLAESFFFPGAIFFLSCFLPASAMAEAVAVFMASSLGLNAVLTPGTACLVLEYLEGAAGIAGWRWVFFLQALPTIAIGLSVLNYLPDRPSDARWLSDAERDLLPQQGSAGQLTCCKWAAHVARTLPAVVARAQTWVLIAIWFMICGTGQQPADWSRAPPPWPSPVVHLTFTSRPLHPIDASHGRRLYPTAHTTTTLQVLP